LYQPAWEFAASGGTSTVPSGFNPSCGMSEETPIAGTLMCTGSEVRITAVPSAGGNEARTAEGLGVGVGAVVAEDLDGTGLEVCLDVVLGILLVALELLGTWLWVAIARLAWLTAPGVDTAVEVEVGPIGAVAASPLGRSGW
jgi:hypothetical protein